MHEAAKARKKCRATVTQRTGKDRARHRESSMLLTRRAPDVISEACFTVMTRDRHDELTAMDLSMIAVALTPP